MQYSILFESTDKARMFADAVFNAALAAATAKDESEVMKSVRIDFGAGEVTATNRYVLCYAKFDGFLVEPREFPRSGPVVVVNAAAMVKATTLGKGEVALSVWIDDDNTDDLPLAPRGEAWTGQVRVNNGSNITRLGIGCGEFPHVDGLLETVGGEIAGLAVKPEFLVIPSKWRGQNSEPITLRFGQSSVKPFAIHGHNVFMLGVPFRIPEDSPLAMHPAWRTALTLNPKLEEQIAAHQTETQPEVPGEDAVDDAGIEAALQRTIPDDVAVEENDEPEDAPAAQVVAPDAGADRFAYMLATRLAYRLSETTPPTYEEAFTKIYEAIIPLANYLHPALQTLEARTACADFLADDFEQAFHRSEDQYPVVAAMMELAHA